MRVVVHNRFWRDVDNVPVKSVKMQVLDFIEEAEQSAFETLVGTHDLKPLRGPAQTYRLAIEDYRVGLRYDKSSDTLIFMRFMHRETIYDHFPF